MKLIARFLCESSSQKPDTGCVVSAETKVIICSNSFTKTNATELLNYSYFHSVTAEASNGKSFHK